MNIIISIVPVICWRVRVSITSRWRRWRWRWWWVISTIMINRRLIRTSVTVTFKTITRRSIVITTTWGWWVISSSTWSIIWLWSIIVYIPWFLCYIIISSCIYIILWWWSLSFTFWVFFPCDFTGFWTNWSIISSLLSGIFSFNIDSIEKSVSHNSNNFFITLIG